MKKTNFKSQICKLLVFAILVSCFGCVSGSFSLSAETTVKNIVTDDFNRDNTELSSIANNGDGFGVGNGFEETTYGYAQIQNNKLLLSGSGNMGSKKYMDNRVMRPDYEAAVNQSVSITVDKNEITTSRFPVLWLRTGHTIWKRANANGYLMYVTGSQVYLCKCVDNTWTVISNGYYSFGSKAVGDVTLTFTATKKDASTTILTAIVDFVDSEGVENSYNWFTCEDTTESLQAAGSAGVSYVDGNGGSMAIDNFTYATTDELAPVKVAIDNFENDTLNASWSETKDGVITLENGSMAIGFSGNYDSNSYINNRAVYSNQYYSGVVNQFVEVHVPVSDIDNKAVTGEGASYPVIWLRDQTVNGTQVGYYAIYNGTGLSINRRNADGSVTTIGKSAYFVLNGSNTYLDTSDLVVQFSAIGTNPTVLNAKIFARFDNKYDQPSLVCSATGTDSEQGKEITTAGSASIGVNRTTSDPLPIHINRFVYYTYGSLDYSKLTDTIGKAEEILKNIGEYKPETVRGLKTALDMAQAALSAGGLTQGDIDSANETLKAEINKAVRFPTIAEIKVNGIDAEFADGQYNVTLSKNCKIADIKVKTNFTDGVNVTVNDTAFTENEKSFTVTVNYNNLSESFTVNAVRGDKHTIVANAGENGIISNAGVTYTENGGTLTYTVTAEDGYCIKNFVVDGVETTLPANNTYTFSNITGDHTITAEFEKMLLTQDSATIYFEDNGGIRFSSDVSQSGLAHLDRQLKAGIIKEYTLGTIMLPTDILDDNELTLNSPQVLNIKRTVWKEAVNEGYNRMTAVITNIHSKNYNRTIVARTYLTVTDANGVKTTIYSDYDKTKNSVIVRQKAKELLRTAGEYAGEAEKLLKTFAELPTDVNASQQAILDEGLEIRNITIEAGIENSFGFSVINDAHLISVDGQYDTAEQKASAAKRKVYFRGAEEKLARAMSYHDVTENMKKIVFCGDIVDASTKDSWLSFLDIVGDRINNAIMAPGNHEFTDYIVPFPKDAAERDTYYSYFEEYMSNNPNFHSEIVNGVNFVSMDNAMTYFTEAQITKLQAEIDKGYPIILSYHVPFPMEGMAPEDTITLDETSKKMYDLICANSDIIKAAVCGHTHVEYNGFFEGTSIPQYIFNATYGGDSGRMTVITVK